MKFYILCCSILLCNEQVTEAVRNSKQVYNRIPGVVGIFGVCAAYENNRDISSSEGASVL